MADRHELDDIAPVVAHGAAPPSASHLNEVEFARLRIGRVNGAGADKFIAARPQPYILRRHLVDRDRGI